MGGTDSTCPKYADRQFVRSMGSHYKNIKEVLAIGRIFSLVDMITNTNFSNCPNVFKIGAAWQ